MPFPQKRIKHDLLTTLKRQVMFQSVKIHLNLVDSSHFVPFVAKLLQKRCLVVPCDHLQTQTLKNKQTNKKYFANPPGDGDLQRVWITEISTLTLCFSNVSSCRWTFSSSSSSHDSKKEDQNVSSSAQPVFIHLLLIIVLKEKPQKDTLGFLPNTWGRRANAEEPAWAGSANPLLTLAIDAAVSRSWSFIPAS